MISTIEPCKAGFDGCDDMRREAVARHPRTPRLAECRHYPIPPENPARLQGPEVGTLCLYQGRTESLSYGDLAYAQSQGWCPSSPDGMGPHRPDETTDPLTCAECGAEIERCAECGDPLTVEGSSGGTGDPVHVFCDLCGKAEHPADLTPDWNDETGNHRSCERTAR